MKKATSKQQRKYGNKTEEGQYTSPPRKGKKVKVMVDGYSILEFASVAEANRYIEEKNLQSKEKRQRPTSFIFL